RRALEDAGALPPDAGMEPRPVFAPLGRGVVALRGPHGARPGVPARHGAALRGTRPEPRRPDPGDRGAGRGAGEPVEGSEGPGGGTGHGISSSTGRPAMPVAKVNLAEKLTLFSEVYKPKIVGEVNDFFVKLVKVRGEFVWHHHENEDELFLVVSGTLTI